MIAARTGGDSDRTRFVVDLTADVVFTISASQAPPGVIIELPEIKFDLPAGAGKRVRGLISEFRYGTQDGKSRIALVTSQPVTVKYAQLIKRKGKLPARVVVDLVPATVAEAEVTSSHSVAQMLSTDAEPVRLAESPRTGAQKPTIVIDAGHGGIDPGAVSARKVMEKEVVLAFAQELRQTLEAKGKYTVVMTRDGDRFLSLLERVEIARKSEADLFIAIHADMFRGKSARGATLYTLSEKASDAEAEALAQKENKADIIAGFDLKLENNVVTDVLIDLAQRESKNHAMFFSKRVVDELAPITLLTVKPIRSAGFVVLKAPDVPSVLVELGYLSSREDEALLIDKTWQRKVSEGIGRAIESYFISDELLTTATEKPLPAAASP